MFTNNKRLFILLALAVFVLGACNLPNGNQTPTEGPGALYTAAAQTVAAQLTQAVGGQPPAGDGTPVPSQPVNTTQPPAATPTQPAPATAAPTNSPLPPTATPPPTATSIPPTATPVPIPCDRAAFVKDLSYPDNAEVAAGTTFEKKWRLKNNGSCTWTSGYALVFDHGDAMGGPASQQLTTQTVAPGQEIDVAVSLKAPSATGSYQGFWKLRNNAGVIFGLGQDGGSAFWVKVKVINPATPTPNANITYDFTKKAPDAEWRNATASLPWGDPADDSLGVAAYVNNVKLNNGKTYDQAIAAYPQHITDGIISGVFPNYTVQNGDHFKASLAFKANCGNANVKFTLKYREGSTDTLLGEWQKSCNDDLSNVNVDISGLQGRTVQFILIVSANGAFDDDRSIWLKRAHRTLEHFANRAANFRRRGCCVV